jgi:hypothetical protein
VNVAFQLVQPLSLLFVLSLWIGPAVWVYRDAGLRLKRAGKPYGLLALSLALPVVAPLFYALLRPAETREDRRERLLTLRMLERALAAEEERCPACRTPVGERFLCCPACATDLRRPCRSCRKALDLAWTTCPYCATRVDEPAWTAAHSA